MSGNGLVQRESKDLYSNVLQLLEHVKRDRAIIFHLLDELDRTRDEWRQVVDRCRQLEQRLKMEQQKTQQLDAENKQLSEENQALTKELNCGKILETPKQEKSPNNLGRKRSNAFIEDEAPLPRKVRRSSTLPPPCLSVPGSAPCNRGNLNLNMSLENVRPKRRSLGDEDVCTTDSMISREHGFTVKRNYISGIKCEHCGQSIRYCVLYKYCNACKQSYHEPCSRKLEIPCLPRLLTPKRDIKAIKTLRLVDYCPDSSPHIPHLIVRCAMHLERTPIEECLYDTLGNEGEAAKLLTEFKTSRHSPDLTLHDNQTIAGCIMMFLMEIREPLIPSSSRGEFFSANDQHELLTVFSSLPLPHRETLAYLLSHWKRLIGFGSAKDFTTQLLSNSMGPIAFGTSRHMQPDNSKINEDASEAFQRLIDLPFDLLKAQVSRDDSSSGYNSTPLSRNGSDSRKNKPPVVFSTVNA